MKLSPPEGIVKRAVKALVAVAIAGAIVAAFHGAREFAVAARLQIVPALLAADALALALLVPLIAVWGRLYCETVCPLGLVQDLARLVSRKKVRRVCSRLPDTKRQRIVRWTVFSLSVLAWLAGLSFSWLDPYAIFGRGITLTGGLMFVAFATAFFGKGRFWCNWICPAGTVIQQVSRFAPVKDKIEKCDHCEECRRCFRK